MAVRTIEWRNGSVVMIDQRLLPTREVYRVYRDHREVARAIKDMVIRGAPAIGVAAAMGIALGARVAAAGRARRATSSACAARFAATRPTAVNLFWAIERMRRVFAAQSAPRPSTRCACCSSARRSRFTTRTSPPTARIGAYGAALIADGATILTHCNAGALATAGYGTALGVIRAAREAGKQRPGDRLRDAPVPAGRAADGLGAEAGPHPGHAHHRQHGRRTSCSAGRSNCVVVGADRIAANGDVANKIGTYSHRRAGAPPRHPVLRRGADLDRSTSHARAATRSRSRSGRRAR